MARRTPLRRRPGCGAAASHCGGLVALTAVAIDLSLYFRAARFRHCFKYSYAFVALPGGFGTLDEIFEVATLVQTGKIRGFPIVLIGREFWDPLLAFVRSRLVAEQAVAPEDAARFLLTDSPAEAVEAIADVALRQFGLTYGPRLRRRWYFGE